MIDSPGRVCWQKLVNTEVMGTVTASPQVRITSYTLELHQKCSSASRSKQDRYFVRNLLISLSPWTKHGQVAEKTCRSIFCLSAYQGKSEKLQWSLNKNICVCFHVDLFTSWEKSYTMLWYIQDKRFYFILWNIQRFQISVAQISSCEDRWRVLHLVLYLCPVNWPCGQVCAPSSRGQSSNGSH